MGIGTTVALLAGCSAEPPVPEPEAPVVAAVVSEPQEREILQSVATVLEGAGQGGAPLASRLTGPALTMREAELKVADAADDPRGLTDLSMQMQQVILPSDQGWPRSSFAVTEQPDARTTPVLMAFEQAGARDQYKLWAYVQLASLVTMPRFAEPGFGSATVPADDTSLLVPPGVVAGQYASVLTVGDRSKHAGTFAADDALRQRLREDGREQVAQIEEQDGEGRFSTAFEPVEGAVKAVRTVDGGAMVLAALRGQETLRAEEGWQLAPVSSSAAALWGGGAGNDVLKTSYHYTVAWYVPPAGSAATVSLLGFHRVPYAVSGG
ncbi:hypothetical protein [Promicromonospora sp. NPDC050880]|uniref:hypothetical protein n=1 Tax=Promicromonospora sp. NPDC050880 TaxID=3364406 RepID=UPI0037A65462